MTNLELEKIEDKLHEVLTEKAQRIIRENELKENVNTLQYLLQQERNKNEELSRQAQQFAQRCAYLESRYKGFDDIVESNNIELKRQSDLIVDLKKQLIIENEKYKNAVLLYQKEIENVKTYRPEQDMYVQSLNKTIQEKEIEIRTLKADRVQLEMRIKMNED